MKEERACVCALSLFFLFFSDETMMKRERRRRRRERLQKVKSRNFSNFHENACRWGFLWLEIMETRKRALK